MIVFVLTTAKGNVLLCGTQKIGLTKNLIVLAVFFYGQIIYAFPEENVGR